MVFFPMPFLEKMFGQRTEQMKRDQMQHDRNPLMFVCEHSGEHACEHFAIWTVLFLDDLDAQ